MRLCALALVAIFADLSAGSATATVDRSPLIVEHGPPALLVTNSYSTNWSGYAVSGTTFTDVKGTWTQPIADCSVTNRSTYSSFWVGIDGYNSGSVEQIGTEADCSHGSPSYSAWFEMYPNPMFTIPVTVTPGASYTGEVKYNGSGSFTLTLSTGGQVIYSTTQSLNNPSLSSAEWIAEAPSLCAGGCHVAPLTDFGQVAFSSATANGQAIGSFSSNDPMTMVTNGGQIKAQPSSLTGGNAFLDTWSHS
jgi:Peptidase A4 family